MKHSPLHILSALAVLCAVALNSCTGDGCTDNSSSLPLAHFYQNGKAVTVSNLSVRGIGAPGDSILVDNESVSEVYLPLPPSAKMCQFEFNYNTEGAPADTITLHYTATPMFANMDCGAMYGFNISAHQFTRHAIDSVALVKPEVTNNNAVTLRIFMR